MIYSVEITLQSLTFVICFWFSGADRDACADRCSDRRIPRNTGYHWAYSGDTGTSRSAPRKRARSRWAKEAGPSSWDTRVAAPGHSRIPRPRCERRVWALFHYWPANWSDLSFPLL